MTLDPSGVVPVPWPNGAGTTRELAMDRGPDGEVRWRVSVADLTHSAPFSLFPGLDRLFVPMGAVRLVVDGTAVDLLPGEQHRFAGEAAVEVVLAMPTRALNVMTHRDLGRSPRVVLRPARSAAPDTPDLHVLLGPIVADIHLEGLR
ncbi:HutD family protein [Nocardioides sp. BP30]|uniref:HutD family protein n=1 Tax=Nocardioides sp. BP30 TaxID=3036374 RepID=UPI00246921BE|nr:HutD family protein [Nocardioides sp. BP30]WGL51675.1 HutD family protein [Nocardioides sp. BP30]